MPGGLLPAAGTRTGGTEQDQQIAKDNFLDIPGVSNEYLNGLYPGRETVAPEGVSKATLRFPSTKDGDLDPRGEGDVLRVDHSTGLPTMVHESSPKGTIKVIDPWGYDVERETPAVSNYYRPEGWAEQGGMDDVKQYTVGNGTAIKMVSMDHPDKFYFIFTSDYKK